MRKMGDFFKRIKVKENNVIPKTQEENSNDKIQIEIEGNIELFKEEKEKILEGAKYLLQTKAVKDMEEAIITFATMFRGLKLKEIKKNEDGNIVITLKETVNQQEKICSQENEIEL